MMNARVLSCIFGVFVAVVVSGCAGPPNEEITQAEAALQAAQAAGADLYAADDFKVASDALADAKAKVENNDYKGAKDAAMTAKQKADAAKANAEKGKEGKKAEAEQKMSALKTEWDAVKAEVEKVKGPMAAEMQKMAADMEAGVGAIQGQMDQGDYAGAVTALDEATMKAGDLKTKAMEAATAKGKKK